MDVALGCVEPDHAAAAHSTMQVENVLSHLPHYASVIVLDPVFCEPTNLPASINCPTAILLPTEELVLDVTMTL